MEKLDNRIKLPELALVVPCYNEQAVLSETAKKLLVVLNDLVMKNKIATDSFIYFVDDGSNDDTWKMVAEFNASNPVIKGLKLSRNFGHQNALYSGLMSVKDKSDCVISIDADLQDDISCIEQFVDKFIEGFDIVYGVRQNRQPDTWFKKNSAKCFYKLMRLFGSAVIPNHADCRLVSNKVLSQLSNFKELNLFLRGIFPLIGFKSTIVYYDRKLRMAGETKYPFKKMFAFAIDGITSFSVMPLRLIAITGALIFLSSLMMTAYILFVALVLHQVIPGWTSTVLPIYFIGGIQLLSIGIMGEYIGKIYLETKGRPRFIIEAEIK